MTHVKFLLSGISSTAVETDDGARALFQERIGQTAALLTDQLAEGEISSELASAVKLLEDYNKGAEHKAQAQQRELRGIISAATDTIAAIGTSSHTGVEQLRALESSLDSASKVEDLRLLRHKLFACLTVLRTETTRMQMDSQMLIRSLTASVLRASSELAPGTDATTGLPGPAALEKDLTIATEAGDSTAVAIFVLGDLSKMNARFGRAAGDELLRLATEHVRETFGELATVYRGNGPSLIAVCTGTNAVFDEFEQKTRAMVRYPFQTSVLFEDKMKNVNLVFSWTCQRLGPDDKMEDVFHKLDIFAAKQLEGN